MDSMVETTLKELLDAMDVSYASISRIELAGQTILSVETEGSGIGSHPDTIHALDYLVRKIVENRVHAARLVDTGAVTTSPESSPSLIIDVNEQRTKHIRDLQTKALMMAERARSLQYDVELSPMSSYERLIIHTTLQNAANVKTESQGEGRERRVVIKYAA
jgi:predicted RNA-binding protein Jag